MSTFVNNADSVSAVRLQKFLAEAGIASRRKAEDLIREGVVTINGQVAKLGDKIIPGKDAIKVSGKLLTRKAPLVYYAFHKPRGVLSIIGADSEEQSRPTLSSYLKRVKNRVFPLGRLEFNSEGLVLLTNDGNFVSRLEKAERLLRLFEVKVKGHPDVKTLQRLSRGTRMGRNQMKPALVRVKQRLQSKAKIEIGFLGMHAVDMKEYFSRAGLLTERIVQTSIGHLRLGDLAPGKIRALRKTQMEALITQPELGHRSAGLTSGL